MYLATMLYLSLCSGIEAATIAWMPLGWRPIGFAEIDPFCCAVLEHHFPGIVNYGDITKIDGKQIVSESGWPDVVVAGTPCQSFSIAGHKLGLSDPRGNVTLHFFRLVGEIRPRWVVWENVPGILSIDGGDVFRQILAAMDEFGYGVAWRVLDAQHFGVPQRRRRVFLVGYLGDWRPAAEVLFGPGSGAWNPAKGGETQAEDPGGNAACLGANCFGKVITTRRAVGPVSHKWHKGYGGPSGDECQNLVALHDGQGWRVRRFTPKECERLQGFPDDWTLIEWKGSPACDTQRYKAIGNSMAVPVIRWIGERVEFAEKITACRLWRIAP